MEKTSIEEFISILEKEKIQFSLRKALTYRSLHHITQSLIVTFAAATPIVAALEQGNTTGSFRYTIIVSSILALLEGLSRLFRFKEIWIRHRKTSNLLNNELREFKNKSGIYGENDNIEVKFKNKIEEIIKSEQTEWLSAVN